MMVLAATAIPVEFRPMHRWALSFGAYPYDVAANVAGYVPVGLVLGELGLLRAVITAALVTAFAENSQLVMMHRDPSAVDIGANVIGAIVGAVIALRCGIRSPGFTIDRWRAVVA